MTRIEKNSPWENHGVGGSRIALEEGPEISFGGIIGSDAAHASSNDYDVKVGISIFDTLSHSLQNAT